MINIHKFVTEDDVNHFKEMSNEQIKEMIYQDKETINNIFKYEYTNDKTKEKFKNFDPRKIYGLPDGDIDVLLKEFREEGFTKYCRKNEWQSSWTQVLNNDGEMIDHQTWIASFRYANKWNQETEPVEYKIIVDNNMKILWIGMNDNDCYFISYEKNIYSFKYEHKNIELFPNISSDDEYLSEDDMDINDKLIVKYRKNMGCIRYGDFENAKTIFKEERIGVSISIEKKFEKYFFYKGPKWNKNYKYMYPNDRTILISIEQMGGLFYIVIENITYPFYGYMLLDLKEIRIIEAGKLGKGYVDNPSSLEIWGYIKFYFKQRTRVYTPDEIDSMLIALHGSVMNRIKLLIKRFILFCKKICDYELIIVNKRYVYKIGIGSFKKEFNEGYFDIEEVNNNDK